MISYIERSMMMGDLRRNDTSSFKISYPGIFAEVIDNKGDKSLKERSITRIVTAAFNYIADRIRTALYSGGRALTSKKASPGIANLRKRSYLNSNAMCEYGEALSKKQTNIKVMSEATVSRSGFAIPDLKDTPNLVAMPLVLKGGLFAADHVVTFVYDKSEKILEYYDPKGLSINDRLFTATINSGELSDLRGIYAAIIEKYDVETVTESLERHQTDAHSCGMHVLNYITRRAQGECIEDVQSYKPLTAEEAKGSCRAEFIELIQDQNPSLPLKGILKT